MSSGTGVGVVDDLINIAVQIPTAGLVGYGDKGIKKGETGKLVVDATKEITGAKAAEEANAMARQQFEESKVQAQQARTEAITAKGQRDIAASSAAGATKTKSKPSKSTTDRIGDVKDFLGL